MAVFEKKYSDMYDLMYKNKDYSAETKYVIALLGKYCEPPVSKILSLGAGTLNHEKNLSRAGFVVDGIDASDEMVKLARKKIQEEKLKNVSIRKGDMTDLKAKAGGYDAVISMFNVIAYLKGLGDFRKVSLAVSSVLKKGGVFIFDCWQSEAVMSDPPQKIWAKFAQGRSEVIRLTEPHIIGSEQAIVLSIELLEISGNKVVSRVTEEHRVQAWKIEEIRAELKKAGLEVQMVAEFMKFEGKPKANAWSVAVVAKKT